ncbi:MAG TPA: hypothetical protein VN429_08125 [Methanospirillum sp.]|uniref:hypothetical protein n=1 Tax=Methanospirillum sp. TaxID=45200 RepID=UPI002C03BBC5|nr:hypothetical protein [Methanospirillum sp.]HWQ64369.1 hypothetical protein [Methanospirillum sp.]
MKYTFAAILILAAFAIYPAFASDVTLKTSQSEYTFPAGEEARVPFVVESSFPKTNVGTLEYTLTRKQSQKGFSFSQTNSQSQSFPISPGSSQNAITLSSADLAEFEVSLYMHYRDSGKDFVSELPPFTVQFVPNQTAQNQGSSGSSQSSKSSQSGSAGSPLTSTTSEEKPAGQGQSSDPFDEMDQQMNALKQQNQQMMQQMLSSKGMSSSGSGSGSQSQNAQQALQNNQMNAQSSALQQQLAQETSQNKKDQQELADKMHQDPLLSQVNQDLKNAGYQQKDGSISAEGKGEGTVSAQYQNDKNQGVSLDGDIQNGSLEKLTASSNESLPIPSSLADDPRYQAEKKNLQQAGYNQTGGTQTITPNETKIDEQYNTLNGKNATISSIIRNGTVESVTVKKEEETPIGWYIGIILLIILICLCCWAGYRYYQKKSIEPEEELPILVEPVDIKTKTEEYLINAEKALGEDRIKDAYVLFGQALRFFISQTKGLGTAYTTEEILSLARNQGMDAKIIAPILERCMMVEYARSTGSSEEATKFIKDIRTFVTDHLPEETVE